MPKVVPIRLALWTGVLCVISCGCYTPPVPKNTGRAFHETASTDVVLLFYSWNSFFIIHPEYRDNGFRRSLEPRDLDAAFESLKIRRDMAVVLIGWSYDDRDMRQIVKGWRSLLVPRGFRRIVCVYGDDNDKLDGLPIIDDWNQPVEKARNTAAL